MSGENVEKTSTVFEGSEIAFVIASVTKGGDLLAAVETGKAAKSSGTGGHGDHTEKGSAETGAAKTGSTGTAASASVPEATGAANKFAVEGLALLGLAGAAVLNVW